MNCTHLQCFDYPNARQGSFCYMAKNVYLYFSYANEFCCIV